VWRIIVQLSLSQDIQSRARRRTARLLQAAGFIHTPAGCWEVAEITPVDGVVVLSELLALVGTPESHGAAPGCHVRHLRVHVDKISD
jgi:hypothetical protein